MEYTNEILTKINAKKQVNSMFSKWYWKMGIETKDEQITSDRLYKKSERINDCLNLWAWNKYEENKLLDLVKVNRCLNNRFCPNCRKLDLAKCIHSFQSPFKNLINQGENPYLLTLTLPNCTYDKLDETIDNLNKSFYKLFTGLNKDTRVGINFRNIHLTGALKVLEITYNSKAKTFHPHLHCIIFSDSSYCSMDFKKCVQGHYSFKRQSYNYHSKMDIHFMKLWTMIINKIRMTDKNFESMTDNPLNLLQVDIKEMDEFGIYEVLKYTFKDTDIVNYHVFETLVNTLNNRRIRQGYGNLYNLKTENVDDGELQALDEFLENEENPTSLITREITELITTYKHYKKISRFTPLEYSNIIE